MPFVSSHWPDEHREEEDGDPATRPSQVADDRDDDREHDGEPGLAELRDQLRPRSVTGPAWSAPHWATLASMSSSCESRPHEVRERPEHDATEHDERRARSSARGRSRPRG